MNIDKNDIAKDILDGYKKLEDGIIEITVPFGISIPEAGELLNKAAKEKGMEYPVFEKDAEFWKENEADPALKTEPGKTYRFKIHFDSVGLTKDKQIQKFGEPAPLGAIAIAEACERLNTDNDGSLFKGANGSKVWVRGSAPGVALLSYAFLGVRVHGFFDDYRYYSVAFAPSVSAWN